MSKRPKDSTPEPAMAPELEEQFALSEEEQTALAGEPAADPEPPPAAPAAEPPAAAAPPAEPGTAPEEPPAQEEPETIETLRARLKQSETDRQEWERRARRDRERLRQARIYPPQPAEAQQPAAPPAAPAHAQHPFPQGIPVELGEDGQYRIRPEHLQQVVDRLVPRPQVAPAAPAPAVATTEEVAEVYARTRAEIISAAEDPAEAKSVIEAGEAAYQWLDGRVARGLQETGLNLRGAGQEALLEFIEDEGIGQEFAAQFPGYDLEELISLVDPSASRAIPRNIRRFVRRQVELRRAAPPAPAAPVPPAAPGAAPGGRPSRATVIRMGDRPRSLALKGGAPPPVSTAKKYADMSGEQVLKLSAAELAEFDRVLAEQT